MLRESNIQLREENRHNFEECQVRCEFDNVLFLICIWLCLILIYFNLWIQKFRDEAQKAKMESERLQSLVLKKEVDAEMCKKELEMQKVEIANLNQRISEVVFCPSSKILKTEYHEIPSALLRITTMTFSPNS